MSLNSTKASKILCELVSYCSTEGFIDYKIDLSLREDVSKLTINAFGNTLNDDKLRTLNKVLNLPRQPELEQQFWELGAGSILSTENQLSLVGMMTDKVEISSKTDNLTINVVRNN